MKSLAFGEILWDVFADSRCLGGAPLNVAGHFTRLGVESGIVSALGNDELGNEALTKMSAEGICTEYVSVLSELPTGFTKVTLADGIPSYAFNEPCAWDQICLNPEKLHTLFESEWDVFCFGTLAQRSEKSRKTLESILEKIRAKIIFFDVNLRKNFYTKEIILYSISHCSIIKMNDEEWPVLAKLISGFDNPDEKTFCEWLVRTYTLHGVLVTKGKKGVTAYFGGEIHSQLPGDVPVVDTVGAGDSFSAAFLVSLLRGCKIPEALHFATDLADFVVSHSGAMPIYDPDIRARLTKIIR